MPGREWAALRRRILADHETLRRILARVRETADVAAGGDEEAIARLRESGELLTKRFEAHLDLEDRLMVPALERLAHDGRRKAESVRSDHREQRLLLDYIIARLGDPSRPGVVLQRDLRSFSTLLLDDMEREEEMILERLPAAAQG